VTVDLPAPRVGPLAEHAPEPIKVVLNWGRRYSLWVFNFGLACCAIEFIAASMARHDFIRLGVIPFAPGPRQADLMVVSGTVTDKMAPAVRRLYDQMPEPKYVISFGACSNSGGPYWDSYCVTKGVDTVIPVDVYVPGCPPRPEALLQGIVRLQEKIAGESLSGRQIQARYAGGRVASAGELQRPLLTPDAIPGRGDALVPRPGERQPEPAPAAAESPHAQPQRGGPETVAIPVAAASRPAGPPAPLFDPETAFLEPVTPPDAGGPRSPSGPETTVIPASPPGGDTSTPPSSPVPGRTPDAGRRPRPGRHRPDHTLADDIFDLGDDDE
jgi:NADH-quinone oxidoreductase subunit B